MKQYKKTTYDRKVVVITTTNSVRITKGVKTSKQKRFT